MKNVLWISAFAPFDNVKHAGGKTHNYYLKEIIKNKDLKIHLISFTSIDDKKNIEEDLNGYNISHDITYYDRKISFENIKRISMFYSMLYNPFQKYGGATYDYFWIHIKKIIKSKHFEPQVIILQWTQIVLFIDKIKALYPYAKIICIEEDVMFQLMERKARMASGLAKILKKTQFYNEKRLEIESLQKANTIFVNNEKDKKLLQDLNLTNIVKWAPYYESMCHSNRENSPHNKDILFYGAMNRPENSDSAIWFISNVLSRLEYLQNLRFVIVGNNPPKELLKYKNERIVITGFVDDVTKYFANSMCFVAPLLLGAGIKVKILEAMSSGIPVLTNSIGIEGIPAVDGVNYIHCESAEDYIRYIDKIYKDPKQYDEIGLNGRKLINERINLSDGIDTLVREVLQ